jgi:hypothetical protein
MKRQWLYLAVAFLLVTGFASVARATPVWLPGVTTGGGWVDADKTWVDDSQLCWAATASNVLSWTGWIGAPSLTSEDQIFSDFKSYWNNDVGNPYYAVEWWFTGTNANQGDPDWAQLTDTSHTGFYTPGLFSSNYSWSMSHDLTFISTYLTAGRGTSIRIASGIYGHFLTVWGVDPATGDLWVTDSDLNNDTLDHYIVTAGHLSGSYSTWAITSTYGLLQNSGGETPTPRGGEPPVVPEPTTLVLLGTGLVARAVGRRRR